MAAPQVEATKVTEVIVLEKDNVSHAGSHSPDPESAPIHFAKDDWTTGVKKRSK